MLAYYDSVTGLVLCKIISQKARSSVTIQVTADRGPYKKGEQLVVSRSRVWDRKKSRPVRGSYGQRWIAVTV